MKSTRVFAASTFSLSRGPRPTSPRGNSKFRTGEGYACMACRARENVLHGGAANTAVPTASAAATRAGKAQRRAPNACAARKDQQFKVVGHFSKVQITIYV